MLRVTNLVKDFGRVRIINSAAFDVREAEIVSLVGPNGAGKTTLINLISGHLFPTSGRIEYSGKDITFASPYKRIKMGMARNFQITHLFEGSTVLDNIRTCLLSAQDRIHKAFFSVNHYSAVTEEAKDLLRLFGLSEKEDLFPAALSEGDKKVLDTAMTFALRSKFLLLDEPTSGVATGDKFKVMDIILSAIRKNKMSCLIVEHDMDIVSDYSDRVLVLSEGAILAEGSPSSIMADSSVREILFGVT